MNNYKMIDLFAGTGAFSYVFDKNNIKCIFANDIESSSKRIYDLNHKNELTLKDIHDVKLSSIKSHEILCGGFPCQPFSIAGDKLGFDDERSNVFWKMLKIIKKHKPKIIILENVKNLTSHDKGKTFKIIQDNLKKVGYYLKFKILNTCEITNVPQNRERIYIIGFLDKRHYKKFNFDFKEKKNKKIQSFLENIISDKYYYNSNLKVYPTVEEAVTKHIKTNTVYQYRRYYVRENKNGVCPTLTANMGSGGHNVPLIKDNKGIRKLTPRECFNLQGFPSSYKLPNLSDSKLYKLAGNAVSVPVVELIVKKLISSYPQENLDI